MHYFKILENISRKKQLLTKAKKPRVIEKLQRQIRSLEREKERIEIGAIYFFLK